MERVNTRRSGCFHFVRTMVTQKRTRRTNRPCFVEVIVLCFRFSFGDMYCEDVWNFERPSSFFVYPFTTCTTGRDSAFMVVRRPYRPCRIFFYQASEQNGQVGLFQKLCLSYQFLYRITKGSSCNCSFPNNYHLRNQLRRAKGLLKDDDRFVMGTAVIR